MELEEKKISKCITSTACFYHTSKKANNIIVVDLTVCRERLNSDILGFQLFNNFKFYYVENTTLQRSQSSIVTN